MLIVFYLFYFSTEYRDLNFGDSCRPHHDFYVYQPSADGDFKFEIGQLPFDVNEIEVMKILATGSYYYVDV